MTPVTVFEILYYIDLKRCWSAISAERVCSFAYNHF